MPGKSSNIEKGNWLKSQAKAFTLIELMIVMAIMMILTIGAVGNFTNVQKQTRVGFAADSLVSAIREQQLFAKSGKVLSKDTQSTDFKNQCYAVKFIAGVKGGLWIAQSDYIGIPKDITNNQIDVCSVVDNNHWQTRAIFDAGINLISIKKDCQEIGGEEKLYFKPPFAQVYEENSGTMKMSAEGKLDFLIGIPDDKNTQSRVEYNLATGEVKRVLDFQC